MKTDIRPIETFAEMREVEALQVEIWNLPDKGEIAPAHLMITFQKNGGLLLGAYADDRLVGFSLGFLGVTEDGRSKLCSAMLGVLPAFRDRKLGEGLKWAQHDAMLARGIDLITWTFDPLETRNARLNLHKLGAVCNMYYENLYGEMEGDNAGLPSDRLQVNWWLGAPAVLGRRASPPHTTAAALRAQGAPLLNPPLPGMQPGQDDHLPAGPRLLLAVPAEFQLLKQKDIALALRWRRHSRYWFQKIFAAGYFAIDLHLDDNLCFYEFGDESVNAARR